MVVVLILASGAAWESGALGLLEREPGVVVLRRCIDVPDLLAAASAGQADVAVVGLDAPGLDLAAVDHLRRFQVRPLAVVPSGPAEAHRLRAARLGVTATLGDDRLDELPAAVQDDAGCQGPTVMPGPPPADEPAPSPGGRVLAVWGPAGAPGRTTVAVAVAAELAGRRRRTVLVDADPYGGAVAQQLGILDEVSGLLAAARLAAGGLLEARFGSVQRALGEHLTVVTGLPRAERWVEVRAGAVEHLLEVGAAHGDVVVDTGFSIESDPAGEFGARPPRNQTTLAAVGRADEVLVVGAADPVGLARLARGLVELQEVLDGVLCGWWSTGCALRSAGPRRTSPAWSRASPPWSTCASFLRTARPSTAPWSRAARWRRWGSPISAGPSPGWSTRSHRRRWSRGSGGRAVAVARSPRNGDLHPGRGPDRAERAQAANNR